jgi:alkanesulfonate monooxygenase SsuD/methylene tetrahydromethanopterin reductase-like flavin-dependent oxidoreductase (luciferase family)
VARRADATGFVTTAIAILPYRQNAVLLAKQAATIHHLFGGRLVLGASIGGRPDDFEAGGRPRCSARGVTMVPAAFHEVGRSEKPIASASTYFSLDDAPESQARATIGH